MYAGRSVLQRYGAAVFATLVFVAGRLSLAPVMGEDAPLLVLLPGVMVAAWYGGFGPGVAATLLSAIVGVYLLLPPLASFEVVSPGDLARILFFLLIGAGVSWLHETVHRSRQQTEESLGRVRASEQHLRNVLESLRESEGRFRLLTEAVPQIVWTAGPDGSVDYYNRRWTEFTGLQPEQGAGWDWQLVVHPEDEERTASAWMEAVETGTPYEVEHRIRGKDGEYRWHLSRGVPVREANGTIARWLGTATDIHDQKQAQEALALADRRKDEFLAMLAHELRNPLAPIISAVQVLRMRGPTDPAIERQRDIIERQARHMARMVDDLLDTARITRGHIELRRERLEVSAVLGQAVETVRPVIKSKGHTLEVSMPGEPVYLEGDPSRLVQVFSNLLVNAARYTPPDGRIWLAAESLGDGVLVRVRDTGIGIPAAVLPHIFDLFTQGQQDLARSEGGLGIGLTMVRTLVEMHGGSVTAASGGLDQGSEFSVYLPVLHEAGPPALQRLAEADGEGDGFRHKVLVVDDNEDAAQTLADLLDLWGHDCRVANDGATALRLAVEYGPDVVALDLGMPGMDGYEVASRLRQELGLSEVLLVALTGYGQPEDHRRTAEAGFDHHLTKPVEPETLRNLLSRRVAPHPARRSIRTFRAPPGTGRVLQSLTAVT